jgi:uncharacterized protein (UPF0548 family)
MTPTPQPEPGPGNGTETGLHPGDAALGPTPDGYRYFRRSIRLGRSSEPEDAGLSRTFERARAMLQAWAPQVGAGMTIEIDSAAGAEDTFTPLPPPSVGLEGILRSRVAGVIALRAPFRVVAADFTSANHAGYAYETLPGHPERGREAFYVTREDGVVEFTVMAFSQPAVWYSRLGGPVTRIIQNRYTNKYLLAMAVRP